MTYSKIFSKQVPAESILDEIKKAITILYALPVDQYNSNTFHDIALGFRSLVYNMEEGVVCAFPLFLKWLKLYVRLQNEIDPKNAYLSKKFEKKIPVCTSYIVAALQYQTKMSNYHQQVMEMCLSLFNSASSDVMEIIASLEIELIALLWMPIDFVGEYNTQKLALKLIVTVLKPLNDAERQKKITEIKTSRDVRNLILKLTTNGANFEQISRQLLNNLNMKMAKNCTVFSVYCSTALFGSFELFKPDNVDRFWIDFNYTSKSVSFLCQLKQNDGDREELSIQIKIDKLQIENPCDCIVLSIEPATFSTDVSTELKNTRIAVFTLPQIEFERLKENRDLLDFYNQSYDYSNSESDPPPTPNTIENYLAEPMEDDFSEISQNCSPLEQIPPEISRKDTSKETPKRSPVKEKSNTTTSRKKSMPRAKATVPKKVVPKKMSPSKTEISQNLLPNSARSKKESGYSTEMSTVKQDSTVFKRPANPVRQKPNQKKPHDKTIKTVQNAAPLSKSVQKGKSFPTPQENDQPTTSPSSSRRFFKSKITNQPVTPPRKPKRSYRKKTTNTTNTGLSPQRKQVNTVKPLDHLTKPDCDPEEAALEFVENGGYANIISFLRSNAGVAGFSEQQRQQIIENIERINEDIGRNAKRFFPKAIDSDSESGTITVQNTKRRKRNSAAKSAGTTNYVSYSMWKQNQKEKTSGQSTMVSEKQRQKKDKPVAAKPKAKPKLLTAFDQLKVSPSELNSGSENKPTTSKRKAHETPTVIADNRSSRSSVSSCSNHNFLIADSDNELVEETSDELMPSDMICRKEPVDMDCSLVPLPIKVSQAKGKSRSRSSSPSQASISSEGLGVAFEIDSSSPLEHNTTAKRRSSPQMSEIFEDLLEFPPQDAPQQPAQSTSGSDSESEKSQPLIGQQARVRSTIRRDVHTQSEPNEHSISTWYIEKFLKDQQHHQDEPPYSSQTCLESTPEINDEQPATNEVIIHTTKCVVSTVRKRTIPINNEDSPLAKVPCIGGRVPLRGYAELLPSYMEQLTTEKDRLLKELERKLQEKFFDNFKEIVDGVIKSMAAHEAAINEAQEQLSFIYGLLECLIEKQQKSKSQLESLYYQLIGRIKAYSPGKEELKQAYDEVEDKLQNYATSVSGKLWQNFANGVVNSIEERLRQLVDF